MTILGREIARDWQAGGSRKIFENFTKKHLTARWFMVSITKCTGRKENSSAGAGKTSEVENSKPQGFPQFPN
jgi:uncharacterized protein YndB with AHSA1/START domain